MFDNFSRGLTVSLAWEGGYSNHPKDPGGSTYKGVTQRTYNAWLATQNLPNKDVRKITDAELRTIYRNNYWLKCGADDLPSGLDIAVFDYAINSGPARAVKDLQRIVGVDADGIAGSKTLAAVKRMSSTNLINKLCDRRLAFLRSLSTYSTFGKGWENRVAAVRKAALALVNVPGGEVPIDRPTSGVPSIKADPADVKLTSTGDGQAAILTGAGTVGTVLAQGASTFGAYGDTIEVFKYISAALALAGFLWVLYVTVKRNKSGDA